MGFVYRLKCSETGLVYYGSTSATSYKIRQWRGYKSCACKDFVNPEVLICIDNLEDGIYQLVEEWYIQNNECINVRSKFNKKNKEYRKKHYIENQDKFREIAKEYYLNNKAKKKQYYLDNKEKIKQKAKQYYLDNKAEKNIE
tara:strand:+ start:239 stop:664 length:426 start_codon:yes stop_codon:yes gene_type:complete